MSMNQWRDAHNKAMRPIVICILAVMLIGGLLIVAATRADGVTVEAEAPQAARADGCPYNDNDVCAVLAHARRIAYDANHDRSNAPYAYSDSEDRIIRNHPAALGNVIGSNRYYNAPRQGWGSNAISKTSAGTKLAAKGETCNRWHLWGFQESVLGDRLFDYDWYLRTCYARKADGTWRVISQNTWDDISNHSASTVKVQGWTENGSGLPADWLRMKTERGIDNCVFFNPICTSGWHPTVQYVVLGYNHSYLEKASWTG